MTQNYYDILGVSKNASKKEIKKAYKKLAKKHHPDLSQKKGSEEKFKKISEAASVLTDEEERKKYDQAGHQRYTQGQKTGFDGQQGFSGFDFSGFQQGGGFDIDDLFDMFMGGGKRRRGRRRQRRKGDDKRLDITLTFEEAALGTDKDLQFRRKKHCEDCDGQGGHNPKTCPDCDGQGYTTKIQRTALGRMQTQQRCTTCNGQGQTYEEKCTTCRGAGVTSTQEQTTIEIPAGVDNGTKLRLRGKGDAAKNASPGDLYLFINVKPHEYYERDGRNIHVEVPISYTQAVFGDEIDVPTLHGDVTLTIPEKTKTNTTFKLRGKGIHARRKGNQYVTVRIETPQKLTKEQREALRNYQETLGEKPQKGFFERIFG